MFLLDGPSAALPPCAVAKKKKKRVRKSKAKYRKAKGDRAKRGTATELHRDGKSKGLLRRKIRRQEGVGSWAKAQLLPCTELPRHRSSRRRRQCWQWPWQSAPWQSWRAPRTASARSAHKLMIALSGQTCGTSEKELQDFFLTCPTMFCSLSMQFDTAATFIPEVKALHVRVPLSSGNGMHHQGLPRNISHSREQHLST